VFFESFDFSGTGVSWLGSLNLKEPVTVNFDFVDS